MKMELVVRELFKLADGNVVLACEGSIKRIEMESAHLVSRDGDIRQKIKLIGERAMLNRTKKLSGMYAIEVKGDLDLTLAEARSGKWRLVFDD